MEILFTYLSEPETNLEPHILCAICRKVKARLITWEKDMENRVAGNYTVYVKTADTHLIFHLLEGPFQKSRLKQNKIVFQGECIMHGIGLLNLLSSNNFSSLNLLVLFDDNNNNLRTAVFLGCVSVNGALINRLAK